MLSTEVVRVPLPTPDGTFEIRAFERGANLYVAMILGEVEDRSDVLVRIHSECLTGDALGSLRCDCGIQLRLGLRMITANGSGVLIYATGHEGRGIGLVNKLRAYVAQDEGADTVEANTALGLPVDSRDYSDAAAVIEELGVRSVRLLTNNPAKVSGLSEAGIEVSDVVPIATAPHLRNLGYLTTKQRRMAHIRPTGDPVTFEPGTLAPDVTGLLGDVTSPDERPYVIVKSAQTVDGRIATSNGDSKWITGDGERRITHALRAACDAVMVGIGTVLHDDPQLTVRHVAGASPMRVILDSKLRIPLDASVLDDDASTVLFTARDADPATVSRLRQRGIQVEMVRENDGGLAVDQVFRRLHAMGVRSVLVEGGSGVITSVLASGLADRLIVSIAPTIIGDGTQAVADLGVGKVSDGIRLANRSLVTVEDDVIMAWDIDHTSSAAEEAEAEVAV